MMAPLLSSTDHKTALGIGLPVALLGCYGAYRWYKSRDLPPGPVGLPILGRLPWLDPGKLHLSIVDMSKQYGDIFSYRMGSQLMIAVCSYELVKEMLDDDNYAARPRLPFTERIVQRCGIIFADGESWTHQRRLALRSLRDFGFARTRSAEMVDTQLDIIFQLLEKAADSNQSLRVRDAFAEATNGVIAQLTLNRRFAKGEKEFEFINTTLKQFASTPVFLNLSFLFPFLDIFARLLPGSNKFVRLILDFHEFIREQIRLREAVMVDDSMEPECLCDVYIMERRRAEKRGDFETFKELQIIRVILEFFLAGTETTARSLEWLLVLMATHPDVQSRVQSELDREVGPERRTRTSDKQNLHFTTAVVEEGYRFASLIALGVFHRAKHEAVFHGYRIPEGAIIQPMVYAVNRDARIWSKPNEFYPEHFLDNNGAFSGFGKNVSFLIGRRACAGESLARMEVFLMFSAIMQRFRVSLAPEFVGKEAEIIRGRLVGAHEPGDHFLIIKRR